MPGRILCKCRKEERAVMKKITAGVVAHVDAGKTTLSESLLFKFGVTRNLGRVDRGDTALDTSPVERERGITVYSSGASFEVDGVRITLLDTPGHVDFSSEAERVFSVADILILVVSSSDGVQSHTRTLWDLAASYDLPVFIFVTKCDLERRTKADLLCELRRELGNCVDMETADGSYVNAEAIAESTEELLDRFASDGALPDELITDAVRRRALFPTYFGSGLKGDGVAEFARDVARLSPTPDYGEAFGARVYKITREKGERLTHLKITGGTLRVKDPVKTGDGEEKVNSIRFYTGEKYRTAEEASSGDVCAVSGLSDTFAGQTLGEEAVRREAVLEPVMRYRLVLPSDVAPQTFFPKIKALAEEDPSLKAEWDGETSSIHVSLMGTVRAEILKREISDRFGVDVSFDSGAVIYKETIEGRVEGVGHYEPLRHYAEVHLMIESAPRGTGVVIGSDLSGDELETRWQRLIMTHLSERVFRGVLTGSELTDVRITLVAGRAHLKHTEGGDFRQATYRAVRQGLMKAKSVLLEPYYNFVMELPTENIGRAITDVRLMGGTIKTNVENNGAVTLTGNAPVKEMDGYMAILASYSAGRGKLSLSHGGYGECADSDKIIKAFAYDAESDLADSPDSVFCAHGAGFVVKWNEVEKYMHVERKLGAGEKAAARRRNFNIDEKELEELMLREFGPIKRRTYTEPKRVEADAHHRIDGVKTDVLIIDGYNVIFALGEYREAADAGDLEGARRRLVSDVANYAAFTGCRAVVVFDAYRVPGGDGEKFDHNGVAVVFTKENETGDAYIERFVYRVGRNEQVRVVTSDWLIQLTALRTGVMRLSSAEFGRELERTNGRIAELIDENSDLYENKDQRNLH